MSCILYLLWPGCMWAAITKALSSGPQGPFTQWRNVCALMALTAAERSPYQGPRPSSPRPSRRLWLHRTVYSTTVNNPRTKGRKKSKGWGGKEKSEKERDLMPGVLVGFHKGASIPAPLEGKKRGGWRVGVHSSLLMPWRGVGFGCRRGNEGRSKPLQTRRPRLANALLA